MIKGLQKDHDSLLDLIISHLHVINTNLLELFDSFIEIFDNDNNSRLLECIHVKSKLSSISIIGKYLKTFSKNDFLTIIEELKLEVLPTHQLALGVLATITDDYEKRKCFKSIPHSLEKLIIANSQDELKPIFKTIGGLVEKFNTLIVKSKFQTNFNQSLYSSGDTVIMEFDTYEEDYESLMDDLFDFKQLLTDWCEVVRKTSPSFIEYSNKNNTIKEDDFGVFMGSFEMESFEKYSVQRKQELLIPFRAIFGN